MDLKNKRALNILQMIGTNNWTGAEQHIDYLAQGLVKSGHNVFVLVKQGGNLFPVYSKKYRTFTAPLKNAFDLLSIIKLLYIIIRYKIDIIHTHHNKIGWIALAASRFAPRCKVVNTQHMLVERGKKDWLHRKYYQSFDQLVFPSRLSRELFLRSNPAVDENKAATIWLGVDLARFDNINREEARRNIGYGDRDFVVAYVGRVEYYKGVINLVSAVAGLKNCGVLCKLLIVGQDEHNYTATLISEACVLGLEKDTKFIGFAADVAGYIKAADVVVLPSISRESFGMSLCEAMAGGVPVISTDTGAQSEIVEDGVNGFLIKPAQPEAIAVKIERLYGDPALRAAMSAAAKKRATEDFSIEAMTRRMVQLYRTIL